MNLRYRLFLWIGSLFLIAFVGSFFFENRIIQTKLEKAKKALRANIIDLNEKKRENIEIFLASIIAETQADISSLLQNISEYEQLFVGFAPTESTFNRGSWFYSATNLVANKWVDFIQNTDDGRLSSLIIPNNAAMLGGCQSPIDDQISWVTLEGHEPYIGIHFYIDPKKNNEPLFQFISGVNPDVYILFELDNLEPFIDSWAGKSHVAFLDPFFTALTRAACYVKEAPKFPEERRKWIEAKMAVNVAPEVPSQPIRCNPHVEPKMKETLKNLLIKTDELFMIWRAASLLTHGPFGQAAPSGIGRFPHGQVAGEGLLLKDVCYDKILFDDATYYNAHRPILECWHPATSLAVINPKEIPHVYLGNTLRIPFNEKTGYLTLGKDIDTVLLKLVLPMNQTGFIVHNAEIVSAFDENGRKIAPPTGFPLDTMLSNKTGEVYWNGEKYFYLHMIPYPSMDLHFFTINLDTKEFSFVNELDKGAKRLLESLLFDMRLVAVIALFVVLLILNLLSKKISRPATQLALAAKEIGAGRLDDVPLPAPTGGKNDELSILCVAFAEMVKGLQEKEKVKGVLNKVVSAEIAQEILKGNVHLGGEEKLVTVLFADIRNFTALTSHMAPIDVIELLNTCMTKISKVIDDTGGVIDKYVGDEVMALFGAPLEKPDSALKAVQSAWEMLQVLKAWNVERKAKGLVAVEMGIGIHTGVVLAGNMGAENRLNYTVLGRNVNLASRLCSTAGGGEILITRNTYEAAGVKKYVDVEILGAKTFKGLTEEIDIYRVKGISA
ncbi:MAG: adenylate/guanylate cyclase domain-containing protein [Chlamydiota bacterium]